MTNLSQKRGTTKSRRLLFRTSDLITPVSIENGIVKVAIKYNADDDNDEAIVMARSYYSNQIQIADAVNGEAIWSMEVGDTQDSEACTYVWGAELTLRGILRTQNGAIEPTTGSRELVYVGPDIGLFGPGDIVTHNGATNPFNRVDVTIMEVDAARSVLITDYDSWQTEPAYNHQTFIANRPDVSANLSGSFTIRADVVS